MSQNEQPRLESLPASQPPQLIAGLPAEAQLLMLASRVHVDDAQEATLVEVAKSVTDWSRVLTLAEVNRVLPLLYRSLYRCQGAVALPERLRKSLKSQAAITALRNESSLAELVVLERDFAAGGIRTLHYKGPTVAMRFYGDLNLRTFHDTDFLIGQADIEAVCEIMRTHGFSSADQLDDTEWIQHVAEQKELLFQKRGFNVEPHWRFTPRRYEFDLDYPGIWRRATTVEMHGQPLRVPSIEDSLVLMLLVGAAGFWKRLQMLVDIAAVSRASPGVDWDIVVAEMKRIRATRVLWLGILLAADLSGASIPRPLLAAARADSGVVNMAREVTRYLTDPELCRANAALQPNRFQWLLWSMREGWRDRMIYLIRTTTTATALHTRRMPLPDFMHGLYRVLVPVHDYLAQPSGRVLRAGLRAVIRRR